MSEQVALKTSASSPNDALIKALIITIAVHIVLLWGISFNAPKPRKIQKAIDITVVKAPSKVAPQDSQFVAPEDQQSAGESHQKPAPEQPQQNPASQPQEPQKPVKPEKTKPKPLPKPIEKTEPKESKPETEPAPVKEHPPEKVEDKPAPKLITQQKAEKKVAADSKTTERKHTEIRPHHVSAETIRQQISQMGSEIEYKQESAEKNAIKYVNQVSANKFIAAQYVKDWESKVEHVGNLNYPQVATKKDFSATLTMQVGINADGSIYSMSVTKSSGYPELDEAAMNIVKMGAPYPPLPAALLNELKVLVITRVWKFSDESGVITQ